MLILIMLDGSESEATQTPEPAPHSELIQNLENQVDITSRLKDFGQNSDVRKGSLKNNPQVEAEIYIRNGTGDPNHREVSQITNTRLLILDKRTHDRKGAQIYFMPDGRKLVGTQDELDLVRQLFPNNTEDFTDVQVVEEQNK